MQIDYSIPRGIRNNNPGNIRATEIVWNGETDGYDEAFEMFTAPEYGIRAMVRILKAYARRDLDTLEEIITTWAPPVENDTRAYVDAVATRTGLSADDVVDLNNADQVFRLVRAIIFHENGDNPYDAIVLAKGITLAGVFNDDNMNARG